VSPTAIKTPERADLDSRMTMKNAVENLDGVWLQ
jgi:hypothetical protein